MLHLAISRQTVVITSREADESRLPVGALEEARRVMEGQEFYDGGQIRRHASGACARSLYGLSAEEIAGWLALFERHGLDGLETTRAQTYRQGRARPALPPNQGRAQPVEISAG
ncbi:DUF1153 domain-containing protein [Phenylobacterium sp.]|uniref:DUF1153 domain-containing protein n=1 Tax=Phenylobacterium sp. TaxID=1871053 RepID=UPI00272FDB65|nr:DUF1153 domain-containing protein [Phenylobacterium sp.]MDP1875171.1 DUF1153 domain-containing protein [Phenylobacterium sp.]